MDELKATFLRAFSNVPLSIRDNTVILLENGDAPKIPISWNVAFIEIINNTENASRILNALKELDLL